MDILILFIEQRNQQYSRQWIAFGLFYIYRIHIVNTYTQIFMLNLIHLNNVHRHKRNVGIPNARGDFHFVICHLQKLILGSTSCMPNVETFFLLCWYTIHFLSYRLDMRSKSPSHSHKYCSDKDLWQLKPEYPVSSTDWHIALFSSTP